MGAFDSDRDLEFGQFAMRLGRVSGEQLQQAVDLHGQQAGSSLGEILVQIGALSTEDRKSLETLFAAHLLVDLDPPADSTVPSKLVSGAADTLGPGAIPFLGSEPEAVLPHEASRFERQELHAEGGLGKVFAAHDRQLNRTVALKEIKGHYADDRDSQARFTKEAEITGRLEHPGIVPVYALGRYADGRPYYAMRFVKGHSLRAAIGKYHNDDSLGRASRALQMRALLGRLVDVCDAVYYAHRRGIVHRDLKPSNIMLGDYGETLVVDWGLAKNLGKRESPTASLLPKEDTLLPAHGSSLSKTMVGKAIGSPAFMSPEQARGEHDSVEFASDIYGLGATLYMILTGRPPVEGKSSAEVLSRVRKGEIDRLRSVDRSIPRPLEAICHKALALEAVDRYPTVRDLRHDLDRFLADEPVTVYQESWLEKGMRVSRRRRWLFPVILVGLLGLITVTGVSMLNARAKERAVTAAFGQIANAYRVIDPFDDNEANIERL
ncbi:MAG: serine/threonine-protein kinase, partial [Planctomycetota bacterium]